MKMKRTEKGQAIILIVVAFVGLIAMSALIIDGGQAYLSRRQAQTAADAGALAGVVEYCVNGNDPTAVITQYVETENNAVLEEWDIVDDELVVKVSITQNNFFAQVFNQPTTLVRADAAASCFPPGAADSVLPIAWSCREPLPGMPTDSNDCEWKAIPWQVMEEIISHPNFDPYSSILYHEDGDETLGIPPEPESVDYYLNGIGDMQLYLVMDSITSTSDIPCIQTDPVGGTVDCDLDGDGRIDILGSGDRSWLILDGDANNGQLGPIVRGELDFGVTAPTWYAGRDGAVASVYGDSKDYIEGKPALIPVFTAICSPTSNPLTDPVCASVVEAGDGLVQINTAASGVYFRVVSFAEFFVTCVSDKPGHTCPGKELARSYGIVDHNTPSIEGYFIDGWVASDTTIATGNYSIDLGIYIISLTD